MKSSINENIKFYRKEKGFTQEQLAEAMGVSVGAVSKWERGESSPDIAVLVEIADLFGVTLDYLVRSENIENAVVENKTKEVKYNRRAIAYISESVGWIVAILAFIITRTFFSTGIASVRGCV